MCLDGTQEYPRYDASQTTVFQDDPTSLLYERKFDTALRSSDITGLHRRVTSFTTDRDERLLLKHIEHENCHETFDELCSTEDNIFAQLHMALGRLQETRAVSWLSHVQEPALKHIKIQLDAMMSGMSPNIASPFNGVDERLKEVFAGDKFLHTLATVAHELSKAVDSFPKFQKALRETRRRKNHLSEAEKLEKLLKYSSYIVKLPGLIITLRWTSRYCLIGINNWFRVASRPYLLLLHNKLCDHISTRLYIKASQGKTLQHNAYEIWNDFMKAFEIMAVSFKTKFFTVAKCLEAFVASFSIMKVDQFKNHKFFDVVCQDVEAAVHWNFAGSKLHGLFNYAEMPLLHEISCCAKLFGHPYVDMEEGVTTLTDATQAQLPADQELIMETVRCAKKEFISSHITKKQSWPPCRWVGPAEFVPEALKRAHARSLHPDSHATGGIIRLTDFDYVELEPCMEFNKIDNIIPYLKDRTISLCRTKVFQWYLNEEIMTKIHDHERLDDDEMSMKPKWEQVRLLLVYLLMPEALLNHQEYLDRYVNSPPGMDDIMNYLVCKIVPKEKELKVAFRGFGCKTYEDRARGIIQEHNVMDFLDEYSEEQAMTTSELELSRKLTGFRNILKAYPGHRALYITIDASKWNNRFRDKLVRPVMRETLGRIFDTPIFERTHEAYQNTLFYVPDEGGTYYWEGQEGGIEGLNQDTWVVVYINMVKTALQGYDVKYHVLCKGDDMRVVVLIAPDSPYHSDTRIAQLRQLIVNNISDNATKLGHKIKVEDSYGSERYFSFSKAASIGRIELPQGTRKIPKCYGSDNSFLPFTDDSVAGAFSNAHGAARVSVDCLAPYLVAIVWAMYHLWRHDLYTKLSTDEKVGMLLVPSLLGGFPIIYFHNMMVRAESDLLSPFLMLYNFAQQNYPSVASVMDRFMSVNIVPDISQGFEGLLMDPYSLPITKPVSPGTKLRGQMEPLIRRAAKNEAIRELFTMASDDNKDNLVQCLFSANVYNTKILSAVYGASPHGLVMQFLRKFETAKSTYDLIVKTSNQRTGETILKDVIKSERSLALWRFKKARLKGTQFCNEHLGRYYDECPAKFADNIRSNLWRRPVEGITMPPIQHQVIFTTPNEAAGDAHNNQNHFLYSVEPAEESLPGGIFGYTAGPRYPFMGYVTQTGTEEPQLHFIEKDELLTKLKTLVELCEWASKEGADASDNLRHKVPNLGLVIEKIVKLYTDVPLKSIAPFAGRVKAGTITHHVRAPGYRESIVPNCLSNPYTRILGDSNTHRQGALEGNHVHINFLHIYCYATSVLTLARHLDPRHRENTVWGVTRNCKFCNRAVQESPIIVKKSLITTLAYHPIAASMIGAGALRKFLGRYNEFQASGDTINAGADMTAELSPLECTVAILGAMARATMMASRDLMARYTQHPTTSTGIQALRDISTGFTQKQVSMSEFKKMRVPHIVQAVMVIVARSLIGKFPWRTEDEYNKIINSVPSSQLEWHPLVEKLHKNRCMNEVVSTLCRQVGLGHPRCYDDVVMSTAVIGAGAVRWVLANSPTLVFVRLQNFNRGDVKNSIRGYEHLQRRLVLARHVEQVMQRYQLLMGRGQDWGNDPVSVPLRAMRIAILLFELQIEDLDDVVANVIAGSQGQSRTTYQYDVGLTVDLATEIFELEDLHSISPSLHKYLEAHNTWPWVQAIAGWRDMTHDQKDAEIDYWFATVQPELKLEVIYTDYATCARRIRQEEGRMDPNETTFVHLQPTRFWIRVRETGPESRVRVFHKNHRTWETEIFQERGTVLIQPEEERIVIPFPYTLHRPFYLGNTSASRLLSIISAVQHGLEDRCLSMDGHFVVCLADGKGGWAATWKSILTNSHIMFSSLMRLQSGGPPDLATGPAAQAIENSNTFDSMLGEVGLGDLVEKSTVMATIQRIEHTSARLDIRPTIVCCDLDGPVHDAYSSARMREYIRALVNVIHICEGAANPHLVLICKVLAYHTSIWDSLVAHINASCRSWYIIDTPATNITSMEVVLIATDWTAREIRPLKHISLKPLLRLKPAAFMALNAKVEELRSRRRMTSSGLNIHLPLFGTVSTRMFDLGRSLDGWSFVSRCMEIWNLTTESEFIILRNLQPSSWVSPNSTFRLLIERLQNQLQSHEGDLWSQTSDHHRLNPDIDYTTAAHALHLVRQCVSFHGLLWVLRMVRDSERPVAVQLTVQGCRAAYTTFRVGQSPTARVGQIRLRWNHDDANHDRLRGLGIAPSRRNAPYADWIRGVRVAMHLTSSVKLTSVEREKLDQWTDHH
jgi:hypothetical protein